MNGGMNPRDRYYAEMKAAEDRRREAQRRDAIERERRAREEERRRREAERQRAIQRERMRRKKQRRIFLRRFLVFLFFIAIILAIVFAVTVISFRMRSNIGTDTSEYKIVYGEDDDSVTERVSAAKFERDGVRYVNYTSLSSYLSMSVMAKDGVYSFIIPESGETVTFTNNSADADVNGSSVRLDGASLYENGDVWTPLSFVTRYMTGVKVTIDEEKHTVTFVVDGKAGFTNKKVETLPHYGETEGDDTTDTGTETPPEDEIPAVEFKSDLSAYEQYMNPTGEERDAYLILVNTTHTIGEDYAPTDLVDIKNTRTDRGARQMREVAEKALEAMFIELFANGYDGNGPSGYPVSVMSAYRSYTEQVSLFNSYVDREMRDDPSLSRAQAEKITSTYSAPPGTSEHQTGLCVDMHNMPSAQKAFADQPAYEWLRDNSWKFGFILRFPEDKQDITGITFEPWHYRYVGRYHAYKIWSSGMCLEEYVEAMENNGAAG